MNLELLTDPLFRLPFFTGLVFAVLLAVLGMYLRLRDEWVAALALAQMASAGALVATALGLSMLLGGMAATLTAVALKSAIAKSGDSGYVIMMLVGWGLSILLVANWPVAEQFGHALFDGQLYFTGRTNLVAALAYLLGAAAALSVLSRPLMLARFFPDFLHARGRSERPYHLVFDLVAAGAVALATTSIGVMASFALVFTPPYLAYAQGRSWRAGLLLAVAIGGGGYILAFELALALDQPFGPVCALVLVAVALGGAIVRRISRVWARA